MIIYIQQNCPFLFDDKLIMFGFIKYSSDNRGLTILKSFILLSSTISATLLNKSFLN